MIQVELNTRTIQVELTMKGLAVSDGDKGDITVSSSGTVWTIDNQAVTKNKLEHIQTGHFLGRHASGTGDVQEVSPAQVRTIINVEDGAEVNNISDANATDLTDGGVTSLHSHVVTKSDVGLGNVDNTSDATKNSATATLSNKTFNLSSNTFITTKAQLNSAVSDGDILYVGDVVSSQWITSGSDIYYSAGRVGLATTTPTRTLTFGSTSTGIALFNTVDQVTNFEAVFMSWSANVFSIVSGNAGTGVTRAIQINGGGSLLELNVASATVDAVRVVRNGTTTVSLFGISSSGLTATSGTQYGSRMQVTISQSSTAGYVGNFINITESSTGSGAKLLADWQVGGSSKFRVTNGGSIINTQEINAQTDSYTLLNADAGKLVTVNKSTAVNVTVDSSLGLSAGQKIDIAQLGAGQITIVASGTTVNGTPTLKLRTQYSACTIICLSTNNYLVIGDMASV